jgi:ParB family transcriptional regulator, chromosome partitioning protein
MESVFAEIVPMKARRYEMVDVDKVKVPMSRNREAEQFAMNVESIDHVGLLKPIRVNDKFLDRAGVYELVFGEGRLLAYQRLARPTIPAEIVTCSRKEAFLQSLIENLARTKPATMEFARELKRLHDEGWDYAAIARVALKSEGYIREYIRLVEQGEERLIQGVEQGIFPIGFATRVAAAENGQIQNVLMDAFDESIVTSANFARARQIIMTRVRSSKDAKPQEDYNVDQLKQDIAAATNAKVSYVREAKSKESRFFTLLDGINQIWRDPEFVTLLEKERLPQRPALAGEFGYESPLTLQEQQS